MEEVGEVLVNSDVKPLNRFQNRMKTGFGYEEPVDFDFVKSIVGSEVSKAITGGVGALTDREELRVNLDTANSPEQLLDVIAFAKKLMAGQLSGYRLATRQSYQRIFIQPGRIRLSAATPRPAPAAGRTPNRRRPRLSSAS
jgi:hypothetical protein